MVLLDVVMYTRPFKELQQKIQYLVFENIMNPIYCVGIRKIERPDGNVEVSYEVSGNYRF